MSNGSARATEWSPTFRERWMERLSEQLSSRPLANIAVPGSHDSGTSTITGESPLAASCPAAARTLAKVPLIGSCCVKPVIAKWSRSQDLTLVEQLQQGVRYLDLRICHCLTCEQPSKEFDLCHAMRGEKLVPALQGIAQFIEQHPKEVLFLDFNHFYEVQGNSDRLLIEVIQDTVGPYLYPYDKSKPLSDVTLAHMWELKKPVILCYHNDSVTDVHHEFWPGDSIPSPWIDTTSPDTLVKSLDANLKAGRPGNTFYVSQCVLTPHTATFLKDVFCCCPCCHVMHNLSDLAEEARDAYLPWMNSSATAKQDINIAISDFVDADGCAFIDAVIGLNEQRSNQH